MWWWTSTWRCSAKPPEPSRPRKNRPSGVGFFRPLTPWRAHFETGGRGAAYGMHGFTRRCFCFQAGPAGPPSSPRPCGPVSWSLAAGVFPLAGDQRAGAVGHPHRACGATLWCGRAPAARRVPAFGSTRQDGRAVFYGGSWSSGDRADYTFVGEALAAQGFVTLVADYGLSPVVRYPGFLEDCAEAARWAWAALPQWGADRLCLVGHSAGAYNAAMLALDSRWLARVGRSPEELAGWAGLAGPYDFCRSACPQCRRLSAGRTRPSIPSPSTMPSESVAMCLRCCWRLARTTWSLRGATPWRWRRPCVLTARP